MKITPDITALQNSLHQTVIEAAAAEGALGEKALAALSDLSAELLPLVTAETQEQLSGNPNSAAYLQGLEAIIQSKAAELAGEGIVVNKALLASNVNRWISVGAGWLSAVVNAEIPGAGVLVSGAIQSAIEAASKPAAS